MNKITKKDLEILNSIIKEYAEKQFSLLGLRDVFPEIIQDIQQKKNTLLKIEMIIKMQSNTQKEWKWLYVDYEKINRALMEILEAKFNVKIQKKVILKEGENKWKE